MFGALDTSASALVAQRTRMDAIAANLANTNTLYNAKGEFEPYRRRMVVFEQGDPGTGSSEGVHVREIVQDMSPLDMKYMPSHPEADANGYVAFPNVKAPIEQINALEASRAYEANIIAAEATKTMIQTSLRLLA